LKFSSALNVLFQETSRTGRNEEISRRDIRDIGREGNKNTDKRRSLHEKN